MFGEPLGWSGNEHSAEGKEHVSSSPVCIHSRSDQDIGPEAKIMMVAFGSRDLLMCHMEVISH